MNNLLISTNYCWADEFDVSGFVIMAEDDYNVAIKKLEQTFETENESFSIEVYFGTNEEMLFESFNEIMEGITVTVLADHEYEVISSFFGDQYGLCTFDQIIDGL